MKRLASMSHLGIDKFVHTANVATLSGISPPMTRESEFIRAELPDVERIVKNECWLEGERRGCRVEPSDDVVRCRVAEIILGGVGAYLRAHLGKSEQR